MRLDLVCGDETIPLDLVDGRVTLGGSPTDDISLEGFAPALLTLLIEGPELTVTSPAPVRVGETVFPARIPRLVVEGEEVWLPKAVRLRRVADPERRGAREEMATAFVVKELLEGSGVSPQQTRAATLTCVTGRDRGAVFALPFDENVLGRGEGATIALRDRAVSRQHARLVKRGPGFMLQLITSSMNGVYVNGALLKGDRALETGDVVEVGQTILRYEAGAGPAGFPTEPVPLPSASEPGPGLRLEWWDQVPVGWWVTGGAALLGVTALSGALLSR